MTGLTPTPVGGEFLVNTSTANSQENSTITLLPNGGFVVAWSTSLGTTNAEVRFQVFDAVGAKVGDEVLVANYNARIPSITTLKNGNFVVSWQDYDNVVDLNPFAIKARLYSPAGAALGDEFIVNTFVSSSQTDPSIAGLENGGFVVAWATSDGPQGDGHFTAVKAQVYDAAGGKVGSEFLVNTETRYLQHSPSVAGLAEGGFVISWTNHTSANGITFDFKVKGQVFNDLGEKQAGEFFINTNDSGWQYASAVTPLLGGGFVAVWRTDANIDGDSTGSIRAQLFNSTGGLVGSEFRVNAAGIGSQQEPSVSALANGGFVVAWRTDDATQDGSLDAIKAQAYDAAGVPVGDEFLVNTQATSRQIAPAVIGLTNGNFAISWTTQDVMQDGSSLAIKAQLFSTGTPVNTLPAGTDATIRMDEDTSRVLTIADFGFTDADAGDVFAGVTIATLPGAGTLKLGLEAVTAGQKISFVEVGAGLLTFTPTANAFGTGYASFTFQVEDQNGGVDASANTLTFNVSDVPEPDPYNGVTINGSDAAKDTISPTRAPVGQPKATALNDKLYGFGGDDSLDGGLGGDLMVGGNGNDKYTIDNALDVVVEETGAAAGTKDLMQSSKVSFTLAANVENGTLTGTGELGITGNELANQLTGNDGLNSLYGFAGKDKLSGKGGNDNLYGGDDSDTLTGDTGNDALFGEAGADTLNGGQGQDILSGGPGADRFIFDKFALGDGSIDVITDFSGKGGQLDRIDLAGIDANGIGAGNGKFAFIGGGAFTGAGAQLRYFTLLGDTMVEADIDADMVADLTIRLTGVVALQSADFIL